MKILYLSSHADPSGAEICLLRLISVVSKEKNIEVYLINSQQGVLNKQIENFGVKVIVIEGIYLKKILHPKVFYKFLTHAFNLKKIIKDINPDIIHAFTITLSRRVLLLKLIGIKAPIVGTLHDEFTEEHFGKLLITIYRYSVNKFYNSLITVSNSTKNIAIKNGINEKLLINIYNGINVKNSISSKSDNKIFSIGCFGRIIPSKGQMILIDAVNILKKNNFRVKCYIIGKPALGVKGSEEYYKDIKEYIRVNNLTNYIEIIEWSNNINEYYNIIDTYVLPSLNRDPFPTVILEAMCYKIPVIASNIGGAVEQVINNVTGFTIEPNRPDLLSEKLMELYNNPNKAKNMGEEGFARITQEFNLEKYVNSHLELYKNILKKIGE